MTDRDRVIMIVDKSAERSANLKSLIEFMDAPRVVTSGPSDCRARVVEERLAAVFVSRTLDDAEMTDLFEQIGRTDPNVPIILVDEPVDD